MKLQSMDWIQLAVGSDESSSVENTALNFWLHGRQSILD